MNRVIEVKNSAELQKAVWSTAVFKSNASRRLANNLSNWKEDGKWVSRVDGGVELRMSIPDWDSMLQEMATNGVAEWPVEDELTGLPGEIYPGMPMPPRSAVILFINPVEANWWMIVPEDERKALDCALAAITASSYDERAFLEPDGVVYFIKKAWISAFRLKLVSYDRVYPTEESVKLIQAFKEALR